MSATWQPKTPRYMCASSTTTYLLRVGVRVMVGVRVGVMVGVGISVRVSLVDGDVPQRAQHVRPLRMVRHHGLVQHVGVRQQYARVAPQGCPLGLRRVAVVGGDERAEECGGAWG